MSDPNAVRPRWKIPEPKGSLRPVLDFLRQPYFWNRLGIGALASLILWLVFWGWAPPFPYREGEAATHELQARVLFKYIDVQATAQGKLLVRTLAPCYYHNDIRRLENLRLAIRDRIFEFRGRKYDELKPELWAEFYADNSGDVPPGEESQVNFESFTRFVKALEQDASLEYFTRAIEGALSDIERNGLLISLEHQLTEGNMEEIKVFTDSPSNARQVNVSKVRLEEIRPDLRKRLQEEFARFSSTISDHEFVAERVFNWLNSKLAQNTTLTWDQAITRAKTQEAVDAAAAVYREFQPGDPLEITALGTETNSNWAYKVLEKSDIDLLRAEHAAYVAQRPVGAAILRSLAFLGMMAAAFLLISGFLRYRNQELLDDLGHFAALVGMWLVALIVAWMLSWNDDSRAELIPIAMLAMLVAIAYSAELAILLGVLASLVFSIAHGYGLGEFVLLAGTSCTAGLLCRSIRSRTRLIYVGFALALVAGPTYIGVNYMLNQPLTSGLWFDGLVYSGSAMMAALFMTAILPFLEQWFDIQTDISLLELGDANHPLLKELVQRAPGTYNHSISVASIAESAAKAVGVNGLLCRVGAYFHDIGKMRKPEYFIENQAGGVSKHVDLVPTMSTLVIVAHVKEGAEMGRQHHLPKRVIDIIEQHHGTTLVEYFFKQAAQQASENGEPDESSFRYPGPKPQSPEAAVVMLADACESASRALRDPGPARLEHLVETIVQKRLADGQFDDCALTLTQLYTIKESIIKSLNAMYHARIKYPETSQGA